MIRHAVFVDRDGVINANVMRDGRPVAPGRLEEFRLLPGVETAVAALKRSGFLVIVVTNQPDVGIGRTPRAIVDAMHDVIRSRLAVDDIRACYHTAGDGCACRKPKPGMLLAAADEFGIDLAGSYIVGDRPSDVEAGRAAGCLTFFVDYGYEAVGRPGNVDAIVTSLEEAAVLIVEREKVRQNS